MTTPKQSLELTISEKKFLKRIETQARHWRLYRWIGLAGAFILAFGGGLGIFVGFHIFREEFSPLQSSALTITQCGWALLIMGFILFTHIGTRWSSDQMDQLLVKLLKVNSIETGE